MFRSLTDRTIYHFLLVSLLVLLLLGGTMLWLNERQQHLQSGAALVYLTSAGAADLRHQLQIALAEGSDMISSSESMRRMMEIEDLLKALSMGGTVSIGDQPGRKVNQLEAAYLDQLVQLGVQWQTVSDAMSASADAENRSLLFSESDQALQVFSRRCVDLASQLQDAAVDLGVLQTRLRTVTGLWAVFFVLGSAIVLRRRLTGEGVAARNVQMVMDHISSALPIAYLTVDEQGMIIDCAERKLQALLGLDTPIKGSFEQLMARVIPENKLIRLQRNLQQLLNSPATDSASFRFEPVIVPDEYGNGLQSRYLCFSFQRGDASSLRKGFVATVVDVSAEFTVEHELKSLKREQRDNYDLMINLAYVDASQLAIFVDHCERGLHHINETLRQVGRSKQDIYSKLAEMFRTAHRLKGQASALNISSAVTDWHEFEGILERLRHKPDLTSLDLLDVTIATHELKVKLSLLKNNMMQFTDAKRRLHLIAPQSNPHAIAHEDPILEAANRICRQLGRYVMVTRWGIELDRLPEPYRHRITDISLQLVQNAILHGIEAPQGRMDAGKASVGQVAVSLTEIRETGFELVVRDDGRGIDPEQTKLIAQRKKLITELHARNMEREEAVALVFAPGFSTREDSDVQSSDGVGLDVVKQLVRELGGSISISSSEGQFTQFRVLLPEIGDEQSSDRQNGKTRLSVV